MPAPLATAVRRKTIQLERRRDMLRRRIKARPDLDVRKLDGMRSEAAALDFAAAFIHANEELAKGFLHQRRARARQIEAEI